MPLFESPLDVIKRRRAETQQRAQTNLQGRSSRNELGRGLATLGLSAFGAFDDPDAEKLKELETFDAAQSNLPTGAVSPQAQAQGKAQRGKIVSGLSPEVQRSVKDKELFSGLDATDNKGLISAGNLLIQRGDERGFALIKQAQENKVADAKLASAKATGKGKNFRQEVKDADGKTRQGLFTSEGTLVRYLGSGEKEEKKAPKTITFEKDNFKITKQWNPETGQYDQIASSPTKAYFRDAEEEIRIASEGKKAEKLAEFRAKGIAGREADDMATATEAIRATPNLSRSIELLREIQTGDIQGVLLNAKKFLGIESGDEGELINNLNKNVLAQLKPVFGAQFTAKEGEWLRSIEASETKSTASNIRLLQTGINLARGRAIIGLEAAKTSGDARTQKELEDFLLAMPEQVLEQPPVEVEEGDVPVLSDAAKQFLEEG